MFGESDTGAASSVKSPRNLSFFFFSFLENLFASRRVQLQLSLNLVEADYVNVV